MVTMGTIWERTSEVVSGRVTMLASIAIPTLFLPMIVRDAFVAYATSDTMSFATIRRLLSIVVLLLTVWGQLAIIAATSDPATDRAGAFRIASNRLLPAIGVSIVMGIVVMLTLIPGAAMLLSAGFDFRAMAAGQTPAPGSVSGGLVAGAMLFALVWTLAAFWIGAKLVVWQPVLVNERNGLRALARSWRLTNGVTWRIIGVMLLFVIVLLVAVSAAQFVTGSILRLVLGAENIVTARYVAGIVASAVSTALIVVAIVFTTRLYDALVGDGGAPAAYAGGTPTSV